MEKFKLNGSLKTLEIVVKGHCKDIDIRDIDYCRTGSYPQIGKETAGKNPSGFRTNLKY